jgi:hypothetical protein
MRRAISARAERHHAAQEGENKNLAIAPRPCLLLCH